jgi:AAA family ATP:ADP antiporter
LTLKKSLKNFLWPIHRKEHRVFLPLALINFCVLFNYTVLRNLKDALLITAEESGAEVIGFVKTWFILPSSLMLTFVLGSLSLKVRRSHLFVMILAPFLAFFFVFGQWIYPNLSLIQISPEWVKSLKVQYPHFQWIFPIVGNWALVLFYILSELFGSASICYGFWLLANASTRLDQAKRFYPFFGIIGNIALFLAGALTERTSSLISEVPEKIVSYQTLIITFFGLLAIVLSYFLWFLALRNQTDPKNASPTLPDVSEKLSSKQSFYQILKKSPVIRYLILLVFAYGCCINLAELTWKHKIHLLYPNFVDYNQYMGAYTQRIGLLSLFLPLLGGFLLRKIGWLKVALITPSVLGLTGFGFFIANLFPSLSTFFGQLMGVSSLEFLVLSGSWLTIFSKSSKYALFDPTKEMVYIPLSNELKKKGKAAVDLAGTRFGKGVSSFYQQIFLIVTAGHQGQLIAPIFFLFSIVLGFWFWGVKKLDVSLKAK